MTSITNTPSDIPSNAQLLAEAIRFEHWARFHCLCEIDDNDAEPIHSDVLNKNTDEGIPNKHKTGKTKTKENHTKKNPMSEAETAIIQVPEILFGVCKKETPHLSALLERIQNTEISMDSSRTHILAFLQNTLNLEDHAFAQEIQKIGTSKKFMRYLDVFYTFVQEEADLEEKELTEKEAEIGAEAMAQYIEEAPIPTFCAWTEKFHQWASQRNFRLELE